MTNVAVAILSALAGFLVWVALAVFAQVDRGNIQGTITDPSGAVVSNAVVRIVSPATNLTQSSTLRFPAID